MAIIITGRIVPPDEPYRELIWNGEFDEAIRRLLPQAENRPSDANLLRNLFDAYYQKRDWNNALHFNKRLRDMFPDNRLYLLQYIKILPQLGLYQKAIDAGEHFLGNFGETVDIYDVFKICHFRLGRIDRAIEFGGRRLKALDRQAIDATPAPPSVETGNDRGKDVIAFSLWGTRQSYTQGAVVNARLAPYFYPGWVCRFYLGSDVPGDIRRQLERSGCEIIDNKDLPADIPLYCRRFLVASDPTVRKFLCRDCDSRFSVEEAWTVTQWLDDGAAFHAMATMCSTTTSSLPACGVEPPMWELI